MSDFVTVRLKDGTTRRVPEHYLENPHPAFAPFKPSKSKPKPKGGNKPKGGGSNQRKEKEKGDQEGDSPTKKETVTEPAQPDLPEGEIDAISG